MTALLNPTTIGDTIWATNPGRDDSTGIRFDRCVDWLLTKYDSTNDVQLRLLISDVLDDLRALGPIEDEFEDLVIGALASIESAFEVQAAA